MGGICALTGITSNKLLTSACTRIKRSKGSVSIDFHPISIDTDPFDYLRDARDIEKIALVKVFRRQAMAIA